MVSAAVSKALRVALPPGTFAAAGGAMLGPKGAAAGRYLASITGVGDYEVGGAATTHGGEVPHFTNQPDKTVIKHREFVANVKSSGTTFTNKTYDINPGNELLFPWLSGVARNYQQYKILGMVAVYKPLTSDYAAGGGMGQVILATNYNVNDLPYTSALQMENSEYAVAVKPSKGALHPIECATALRRNDPFYVYDPAADSGSTSDKRFYDMGKLQVATEGLSTAADVTIGQLWVTYEIELLKPILPITVAPPASQGYDVSYWSASEAYDSTGGTGWVSQFTSPNVTVAGQLNGTSSAAVTVTIDNVEADKDIILMYYLQSDNLNSSSIATSNFDVTPATPGSTAQHTQSSLDRPGANSSICGHAVGRVVTGSTTATFSVITTLTTGTTFDAGWFYIYTPTSS